MGATLDSIRNSLKKHYPRLGIIATKRAEQKRRRQWAKKNTQNPK